MYVEYLSPQISSDKKESGGENMKSCWINIAFLSCKVRNSEDSGQLQNNVSVSNNVDLPMYKFEIVDYMYFLKLKTNSWNVFTRVWKLINNIILLQESKVEICIRPCAFVQFSFYSLSRHFCSVTYMIDGWIPRIRKGIR